MCMLCVLAPGVMPDKDKLENSALNNPDGFGFALAIPEEDRIHVETTMNPDTSIKRFIEMREMYPNTYALWHARLATHGSTNIENCHPFRVGDDARSVLAHNGVLPVLMYQGDKRSDTRVFAEDVLPSLGGIKALDTPQIYNLLEEFCAGSKVCILTIEPEASAICYIINEKLGKQDDKGAWWSNDSCELTSYYSRGHDYSNKWTSVHSLSPFFYGDEDVIAKSGKHLVRNPNESTMEACHICGAYYDWNETAYCPSCLACIECLSPKDNCLCYTPDKEWQDIQRAMEGL